MRAAARAPLLHQQHPRSNRMLLGAHAQWSARQMGARVRAIVAGTSAAY
jgi:hypothetical protein